MFHTTPHIQSIPTANDSWLPRDGGDGTQQRLVYAAGLFIAQQHQRWFRWAPWWWRPVEFCWRSAWVCLSSRLETKMECTLGEDVHSKISMRHLMKSSGLKMSMFHSTKQMWNSDQQDCCENCFSTIHDTRGQTCNCVRNRSKYFTFSIIWQRDAASCSLLHLTSHTHS